MPKQIYQIEILGEGGKDAAPVVVIPHDAADDLTAYLSAEEHVRLLNDPRMVSWRLVILNADSPQPVRLNKEQQRAVNQRRDDVFFAARRDREAAEKTKFETLKAQRLAAVKKHTADMPAYGSRKPQKLKRTPLARADDTN